MPRSYRFTFCLLARSQPKRGVYAGKQGTGKNWTRKVNRRAEAFPNRVHLVQTTRRTPIQNIGYKNIIPNNLNPVTESGGMFFESFPVVFIQTVLEGNNGGCLKTQVF